MWFNGPITEAIGKAKTSKVILVVFVRHVQHAVQFFDGFLPYYKNIHDIYCYSASNILSDGMESFWTDEEIAAQCQNAGVILLKLTENSESARQFAQIYPVTVIPSSFLIGRIGVPLEILTMTNHMTRDAFSAKVRTAIQTHAASLVESSSPSPSAAQLPSTSTTATAVNAPTAANEPKEAIPLDEKVERAKQLLAEKRAADEEKAKAEAREKELKRREEGKAMRDAQELMRERELRDAAKQRRLEKQQNDAALKRLREQIAADRAEQQALKKRNEAAAQGDAASSNPIIPSEPARPSTPPAQQQFVAQAARSDEARIQCRFADGTKLVHTFSPDDALQELVTLIEEDGREPGNFYLVQMYPRREFSSEELRQSFRELGLAPSAVLVVMPESGRLATKKGGDGGVSSASAGGVTGILSALFATVTWPLFGVYHFLLTFLGFGNPNPAAVRAPPSSNKANNSTQPPRSPSGNVHRFNAGAADADDDDMGTYNGNSTQQL